MMPDNDPWARLARIFPSETAPDRATQSKDGLRGWDLRRCPVPPAATALTSGSTGEPLPLFFSREAVDAMVRRGTAFLDALGVGLHRVLVIGSAHSLTMNQVAVRALGAAGHGVLALAPESIGTEECSQLLRQFEPTAVFGFPSHLFQFFQRHDHPVEFGVRTGEPLAEPDIERLRRMSGARWFNLYGAYETSTIAGQTASSGEHLRLFDAGLQLSILADDGSIADEGEGSLLVTDLNNHAMPIIRYRLGDRVALSRRHGTLAYLGRDDSLVKINNEMVSRTRLLDACKQAVGDIFCLAILPRDAEGRERVVVLAPADPRDLESIRALLGATAVRFLRRRPEQLPVGSSGKRVSFVDLRTGASQSRLSAIIEE